MDINFCFMDTTQQKFLREVNFAVIRLSSAKLKSLKFAEAYLDDGKNINNPQ